MPRQTSDHKKLKVEKRFICKPLDSYNEIMLFLENPPPWRTLCKELTPHSNFVIRNIEINANSDFRSLDKPESFCHYDPDLEDVKRYDSKSLPKTLVCHDMANGYHDDCIIDGTGNSDAYTFYNWGGIDTFCYFSHHLITIPPLGWINIGHAHGVKVIGTLITEWAEGTAFWDEVLSSETQYQNVASALVAIAKTLKFDGYLLNIENKIAQPEQLLKFVQQLHRLLHDELPHATLIWYDSVTVTGSLSWQNKLTDKNKAFFDACDGLFTNYSWTVDDVWSSVDLAGDRLTDVYIGIDIWGRNFIGGGQFNTQEAIKVVHAAGCSIALFAPAWSHEALSSEKTNDNHVAMSDELDGYGKFLLRDRALWGSLWPYLNTRLPCHIPFQTSFCRGQGHKRCLYGEVLSPSPWFNLRHQQYQPNAAHGPHGYLIAPIEDLFRVQREVQYKDNKGVIRIRSSFQQSRAELFALNKNAPLPYNTSVDSAEDAEPSPSPESQPRHDDIVPDDTKEIGKTKVEALKNIQQKSLKISDSEQGSTQESREQHAADTSGPTTGNSMEQVSMNLRLSGKHKARYGLAYVCDESECLELYLHDSFTGGSCLKVNPSDRLIPEHRVTRLFHCDFRCEDALIFCVVTKQLPPHDQQTLNVRLAMKNAAQEDLMLVLTGREVGGAGGAGGAAPGGGAAGIQHVYPLRTSREPELRRLRTYLLLAQPGFYVPIDNLFGWTVRYYEVSVPGSRITSVSLRTGGPQGAILLGHFGICCRTNDENWMKILQSTPDDSDAEVTPIPMSYRERCVAQ